MLGQIQSGGGTGDPDPLPRSGKSQVAVGFLRNTGTDPLVLLFLDGV